MNIDLGHSEPTDTTSPTANECDLKPKIESICKYLKKPQIAIVSAALLFVASIALISKKCRYKFMTHAQKKHLLEQRLRRLLHKLFFI